MYLGMDILPDDTPPEPDVKNSSESVVSEDNKYMYT